MKTKLPKDIDLLEEFFLFIKASERGKRTKKNGDKLMVLSIRKLRVTYNTLEEFSRKKNFILRIKLIGRNKVNLKTEKQYWKRFYQKFTDYLYTDLDCYDNYVGSVIKDIRTFFNYLITEKQYSVGNFYKQFYIPKEDIDILTLSPDQVNFLINDTQFENSLSSIHRKVKDILVVGCTIALRYSDLINLRRHNLEQINGETYVKTQSKKSKIYTRVKVPLYTQRIFKKYLIKSTSALLPYFNLVRLNIYLKELFEKAGWNQEVVKTRQKRGVAQVVYRDRTHKTHFRFCDLVSSHIMRRTAITSMLRLKMPEHLVKKVSGHSPNSKEFYKYVAISQNQLDEETDRVFLKLAYIRD